MAKNDKDPASDMTDAELEEMFKFYGAQAIGEALPETGWPNLPQVKYEDLVTEPGSKFVFLDVVFRRSPKLKNSPQFAVAKVADPRTKTEFTTACASVVTEKLRALKEQGELPVVGMPVKVVGGDYGGYFDLI